jgi:hypothetical protein
VKPRAVRCVRVAMRIWLVLTIAACGGKTPPPNNNGSGEELKGVVKDTRTEFQKRRDTGCEQVANKLTACALEDLKAEFAKGAITEAVYKESSTPAYLAYYTKKYVDSCRMGVTSSRQIRVLEVCYREETECDPLAECVANNIQPQKSPEEPTK